MSSTFGEDTFTREINNMDRELSAMLASRGTQEGPSPSPASPPSAPG